MTFEVILFYFFLFLPSACMEQETVVKGLKSVSDVLFSFRFVQFLCACMCV